MGPIPRRGQHNAEILAELRPSNGVAGHADKPWRSLLFVPADKPELLLKAAGP
jgi:hypothetical protein